MHATSAYSHLAHVTDSKCHQYNGACLTPRLHGMHNARQRRPVRRLVAPTSFEPQVDAQALSAQLVVLTVTASTALYWWYSVVPSARRTLAKEKRSGPLSEYLQDLQQNPNKPVEQWFYTDWLRQLERRQQMAKAAAAKRAAAGAAGLTSRLSQEVAEQKQMELPQQAQQGAVQQGGSEQVSGVQDDIPSAEADVDKQPSFWSLDNPILATAALLTAAALVSSVLHL